MSYSQKVPTFQNIAHETVEIKGHDGKSNPQTKALKLPKSLL